MTTRNPDNPAASNAAHTAKVLLVTRNFPPLWGGMELLNLHMSLELVKHAQLTVIAPRGAAEHAPTTCTVLSAPLKPLFMFLVVGFWKAIRFARRWRPDRIFAGSGLTAPIALIAAHISGGKSCVYLHGLDIAVRHPLYNLLWLPAIRRMDIVVANSSATAAMAVQRGVAHDRIAIVHPGVDIPEDISGPAHNNAFRDEYGLRDRHILLSVGRLTERKGLRQFVEDALPRIVSGCPSAVLIIIGDAPANSLHATSQSPASIQQAADALQLGDHLRFLGVITDRHKLAEAYCAADVHVFPVRELPGDPEGFGMVAVEAASFGLATVAFDTGGITDAVAEGKSGYLVAPGDTTALATTVLRQLRDPLPAAAIRDHARRFAWPLFGERLRAALWRI